jgi:hypothetical protein
MWPVPRPVAVPSPAWQSSARPRARSGKCSSEEIERQWERQRPELVIVHENVWTAGQKPEVRAANIALEFPSYKEYQKYDEPGLDAADAIGMGLWWIGQQKIEAALKAVEPAAPQRKEN